MAGRWQTDSHMPKLIPLQSPHERAALLGAPGPAAVQEVVEPTSRDDIAGRAPSHSPPAEDSSARDSPRGDVEDASRAERDNSTDCCACGRLKIADDADILRASNGERMLKHEDFVPWFSEDSWRMAACGWSTPASAFMALGGCSLVCTEFLRAACPADSFRFPRSSNRAASACFGVGVSIFWICAVYLTKALPLVLGRTPSSSLCSVGAEKTADKGPLELIGLRDSGKPQRLSETAVQVRTAFEPRKLVLLCYKLCVYRSVGASPRRYHVTHHLLVDGSVVRVPWSVQPRATHYGAHNRCVHARNRFLPAPRMSVRQGSGDHGSSRDGHSDVGAGGSAR